MSRAEGVVYGPERVFLGAFLYDGTSDVAYRRIYLQREAMLAAWSARAYEGDWHECTCGGPHVPVTLYSTYGAGFEWESEACMRCLAITGAVDRHLPPDDKDYWGFGDPEPQSGNSRP